MKAADRLFEYEVHCKNAVASFVDTARKVMTDDTMTDREVQEFYDDAINTGAKVVIGAIAVAYRSVDSGQREAFLKEATAELSKMVRDIVLDLDVFAQAEIAKIRRGKNGRDSVKG